MVDLLTCLSVRRLTAVLLPFLVSAGPPVSLVSSPCVNMPQLPMHGSLIISGKFFVRLKCDSPDMDLPLNAPGEGGVFVCDPNDPRSQQQVDFRVSECLPLKKPDMLFMSVRLSYTSGLCRVTVVSQTFRTLMLKNLQDLNRVCGSEIRCSPQSLAVNCSSVPDPKLNGHKSQLDITFRIEADFVEDVPISFYLRVQENIRTTFFATGQELQGANYLWGLAGLQLKEVVVHAWKANCEHHPNTLGTNLALHNAASCRGCPLSYTPFAEKDSCQPCSFGFYTTALYADSCEPCPPQELWTLPQETMMKLCYERL